MFERACVVYLFIFPGISAP